MTYMLPRNWSISLRTKLSLEISLLGGMLVTLLIPSNSGSIASWREISPLLLLRAFVWLLGSSILPGVYVLRLTKIAGRLPWAEEAVVGIHLSLVLTGLATLILYFAQIGTVSQPWVVLSVIGILCSACWLGSKVHPSTVTLKISIWNWLLTATIAATMLIAFGVQLAQQYLIAGDNWVAVRSGVEVASNRNIYTSFMMSQYPIFFGFILAGLSTGSGLPGVNSYVMLSPLVTLNILAFFTLAKTVFSMNHRVCAIASTIYGFGGGLGWLAQTLLYHGSKSFWDLSMLTQDMYFSISFWNDIQFSYKSLALTLAYTSLIVFALGIRSKDRTTKMTSLTLSSLFMIFSFFIHMLEPMILTPIIVAIAYVHQKGRNRCASLGSFVLITFLIASVMDLLMSRYYTWLTYMKIQTFFSTLSAANLLYILLPLGIAFTAIMIKHLVPHRLGNLYAHMVHLRAAKLLFVVGLMAIYLSALFFWNPPSLKLSASFPWYSYMTRYGFTGVLAIIGVAVASWREKWFTVAAFWSLDAILLGSLWWGSRMNGYLFPMIALSSAVGISMIWERKSGSRVTFTVEAIWAKRSLKLNVKRLMGGLILITLAVSFTSTIYGALYYCSTGPSLTSDEATAFSWINQNIPENATILAPNAYVIYRGVETISDRNTYTYNRLPNTTDITSLTGTLDTYNIKYLLTIDDKDKEWPIIELLLSHSTLLFQSGNVRISRLLRQ